MNWSTKPSTRLWLKAAVALLSLAFAARAAAAPTVQEFPLTDAGSQPQDLVLGPDGNIWFAERGISKIGRISASNPDRRARREDLVHRAKQQQHRPYRPE
jgi:streptogramin lyase